MIKREQWKQVYQDRLVIRVLTKDGRTISQGKRLSEKKLGNLDFEIKDIQKVYVKSGTVKAVKFIREQTYLSIRDCLAMLDNLRGPGPYYWNEVT